MDKDPTEWILTLEVLRLQMNDFGLESKIMDEDFMIHFLNELPKEYDVTLEGLE